MGFDFGGTSATVSLDQSGSVNTTPGVPAGATVKSYTSAVSGTATTTAYATIITITAGKTFYLCGSSSVGGASVGIMLGDGGTDKIAFGNNYPSNISLNVPIAFETSVQIKTSSNSAGQIYALWGYEI